MRRNRILLLIFVLVLAIAAAACWAINYQKEAPIKTVNLNDYILKQTSGWDGYGSLNLSINWLEILNENTTDKTTTEKREIATVLMKESPYVMQYQKDELKNNDVVDIKWEINNEKAAKLEDMLGMKFQVEPFTYNMAGLDELQDYDPFSHMTIDTHNTTSGKGELSLSVHLLIDNEDIEWKIKHDGENGALKNGDLLHLEIIGDIDQYGLAKKAGLKITRTKADYVVDCLGEYATDDKILHMLTQKEQKYFDKVVEDWVVGGWNDSRGEKRNRKYSLCGYLFYPGLYKEKPEGFLVAIYKIEDNVVPDGYYVYIGLSKVFILNNNGVSTSAGKFPEGFMYYEKEVARYDEFDGWGLSQEEMSFMYNGVAYAGHRKLSESIAYLDKRYGPNYAEKYMDQSIAKILKNESKEET